MAVSWCRMLPVVHPDAERVEVHRGAGLERGPGSPARKTRARAGVGARARSRYRPQAVFAAAGRRSGSTYPSASSSARTAFLSILPVVVRGSASRKSTSSGELPFREPLRAVRDHRPRAELRTRRAHDEGDRTLVPPRMRLRDDRRLRHAVEADDVVLEVDRRDPLAARLHQVLGTVGDDEVLLRVDGRDVSGDEPSVPELVRLGSW